MVDLWRVVAEIGLELHPRRLATVARKIGSLKSLNEFDSVISSFGPNDDGDHAGRLKDAWQHVPDVSPAEVAAALAAASATASLATTQGSTELVWTGPSTGLVPVRQTEQVLCEVIDSARYRLFLVSFVAYEVPSITRSLRAAVGRHVQVDVLLESSKAHGGAVTFDSVRAMKDAVPSANVFVWKSDSLKVTNGRPSRSVHAKCAVADAGIAFITSANLSTAAMERNMELGLLIRGGAVPDNLDRHLDALVTTGIVERV